MSSGRALIGTLLILVGLLCNGNVQATSFFDPMDGNLDFSQFLSDNAYGFLPVPIIITDPAVDGGLGAVGLFFHEDDQDKEARLKAMSSADSNAGRYLLPPNVSALAVAATGNGSWFTGGGHMGFFRNGDLRYTGGGGYGDVNLDFFGFGDISLSRPIELNTQAAAIVQNIKFRIPSTRWFLGGSQRYIKAEVGPNSLGPLDDILPPEWSDSLKSLLTTELTTSALGAIAEYDSRDNIFTPRKGYQYQFQMMRFDEKWGSDVDYWLYKVQGLNYWPISAHWRVGLKLATEFADADQLLPPYATPAIQLRGIPAMRYQGKLVGMAETELVWEPNKRWRGVLFTGAGKAANSGSELSDATYRNTYGGGFRYQIARRYGFDMGMDIAKGPEDVVWYITAGSAWGGF